MESSRVSQSHADYIQDEILNDDDDFNEKEIAHYVKRAAHSDETGFERENDSLQDIFIDSLDKLEYILHKDIKYIIIDTDKFKEVKIRNKPGILSRIKESMENKESILFKLFTFIILAIFAIIFAILVVLLIENIKWE